MPDDTVIRVENLSKQYRIGAHEGYKTFRETLVDAAKAPFLRLKQAGSKVLRAKRSIPDSMLHAPDSKLSSTDDTIWALKDVSFEIKQGEVVGIIGRNGAGKSTLLKILSQITEPTEGRVELRGRIGSLLEVGTGFHPELTGHENVYLYGAILGMDRWEVTKKFDEIIAFAELEKFVDTPVKRYSSGMYMRLAFAVAAHMEPEILLIDEVLAVGDAVFQTKCLAQMKNITSQGRTVLFVSHNMAAVGSVCQRGIVLDEGQVLFEDSIQNAINYYEKEIFKEKYLSEDLAKRSDRSGSGEVRLVGFNIENEHGEKIDRIPNGYTIRLVFDYGTKSKNGARNVDLHVIIKRENGEMVFQLGTRFTGQKISHLPPNGHIVCTIRKFPLVPGRYKLGTYLQSESNPADYIATLAYLDVIDGDFYGSGYQVYENESKILVDGTWSYSP
jgi:lipopolysaccharide transport system ATP-binding protein